MSSNQFLKRIVLIAVTVAASSGLYAGTLSTYSDRSSFTSALVSSIGPEGFEDQTPQADGLTPLSLSTLHNATLTGTKFDYYDAEGLPATLTGKITGNCTISNPDTKDSCGGRFNTTTPNGAIWWESPLDFTIMFTDSVDGFGFDLSDYGDFQGSLVLQLLKADGQQISGASRLVEQPNTGNGSLQFFGLTDTTGFFGVKFSITQWNLEDPSSFDYLGFDELLIGQLPRGPETIPEPATLALTGLGLLGLAVSRRKQSH